jgi:hypothetical protein
VALVTERETHKEFRRTARRKETRLEDLNESKMMLRRAMTEVRGSLWGGFIWLTMGGGRWRALVNLQCTFESNTIWVIFQLPDQPLVFQWRLCSTLLLFLEWACSVSYIGFPTKLLATY